MVVSIAGILLPLLLYIIAAIILIAIIRFAIDSSKTSKKMDALVHEIQLLRNELKENAMKK